MKGRILWLDNDRIFIRPHIRRLRSEGFEVTHVHQPGEAIDLLSEGPRYDLFILDVMLPIAGERARQLIPNSMTDSGRFTGVVLYERFVTQLDEPPKVLAFTLREDSKVREALIDAGLPESAILTKGECADARDFVTRVSQFFD